MALIAVLLLLVVCPLTNTGLFAQTQTALTLPPNATKPEEPKNTQATSSIKTPVQSDTTPHPELVQQRGFAILPLLLGITLGLLWGLVQLVQKFRQFLGLGIFTNPYSWLFLAMVITTAGLVVVTTSNVSNKFLEQNSIWQDMSNQLMAFMGVFSSPIVRQISKLFGRFSGQSRQNTSPTDEVKELEMVRTSDFLFEQIRSAIADKMDREVARMARQYDWSTIKDSVSRLITNETTLGRLPSTDGEALRQFVHVFERSPDTRIDTHNKYSALHEAIKKTSFRQLQSRLVRVASEQP